LRGRDFVVQYVLAINSRREEEIPRVRSLNGGGEMFEFLSVQVKKPQEINVVLGQSHFIKTVEDLYEAVVSSVPAAAFGLAFVESSGACKVRVEGNDEELKRLAAENALEIGAGHTFIILLKNAFPINVLNAIKAIPEVCGIYCASANPLEVIIAQTETGRGIMGVIDGAKPKGIENKEDIAWRKDFLRKLGYKL
jgi:adenosine/AMP kinase